MRVRACKKTLRTTTTTTTDRRVSAATAAEHERTRCECSANGSNFHNFHPAPGACEWRNPCAACLHAGELSWNERGCTRECSTSRSIPDVYNIDLKTKSIHYYLITIYLCTFHHPRYVYFTCSINSVTPNSVNLHQSALLLIFILSARM